MDFCVTSTAKRFYMKPEIGCIATSMMIMLSLRTTMRTLKGHDRRQFPALCSMAHGHSRLKLKASLFGVFNTTAISLAAGAHNFLALVSLGVISTLRTRLIGTCAGGFLCNTFRRFVIALLGSLSSPTSFWRRFVSNKNLAHASIATRSASILSSFVTWKIVKVFDNLASGTWFHHNYLPPANHCTIDNGISQM